MDKEKLKLFLVTGEINVVEAMQKIDSNVSGILFLIDYEGRLLGTITDGDIRRWIIKTGDLNVEIKRIMNKSPKYIYQQQREDALIYMQQVQVRALPVLDSSNRIVDIIFEKDHSQDNRKHDIELLQKVSVVVMAGGKGTRLYPFTKILPKPLIPIGDIPIMERIMCSFHQYGVKDFIVTVNYRKNMIKSYFTENSMEFSLDYVEEDKPLGTAGSLKLIQRQFDRPIIVTNCDVLIQANYADIYRYHMESENALTIVSSLKNIIVPYGVIHAKENGTVISMEEKPHLSYFVNTGMYIMNPELIEKIPNETYYHMTDLTDLLLKEGTKVGMYPISEDSFLDMGEFEEMRRMERKLNLKSE